MKLLQIKDKIKKLIPETQTISLLVKENLKRPIVRDLINNKKMSQQKAQDKMVSQLNSIKHIKKN